MQERNGRTRAVRHARNWPDNLLPPEGQGDFRSVEAPDVNRHKPARFHAIRNGVPAGTPYVYGAPRPAWTRRGLDLEAIYRADQELAKTRT